MTTECDEVKVPGLMVTMEVCGHLGTAYSDRGAKLFEGDGSSGRAFPGLKIETWGTPCFRD